MHGLVRRGRLGGHLRNAEREGLTSYLRMDRFVHANTDGPANPYAQVYGIADIRRDFPNFRVTGMHKEFMHAPPLPVHRLPGGHLMGWHLWVEMDPMARPNRATPPGSNGAQITHLRSLTENGKHSSLPARASKVEGKASEAHVSP
jgi:hypothetical protein